MRAKTLRVLEPLTLVICMALIVLTAVFDIEQTAILSLFIVTVALIPFFMRFEHSKPKPRDIIPIVVLSVIAALGRTIFAMIPNFQPVTAIVIVAGIVFGSQSGFLTGALAALASNMFLGQGPWTPWQMLCWGLAGYLAGVLQHTVLFKKNIFIFIYGFIISWVFGWIMNIWFIIGFIDPINWETILSAYAASVYFDLSHAVSTVLFLALILVPWRKKLDRIKIKYGLVNDYERED